MTTSPEDDALTRDEDQLQRTAEHADGMREQTRDEIPGRSPEGDVDNSEGEQQGD